MTQTPTSDLLIFTVADVAKLVGVDNRTVTKWCDRRDLKSYRVTGSSDYRIPRTYLVEFLAARGLMDRLTTEQA